MPGAVPHLCTASGEGLRTARAGAPPRVCTSVLRGSGRRRGGQAQAHRRRCIRGAPARPTAEHGGGDASGTGPFLSCGRGS
eukprot:scaffold55048_cov57-Phaeocystis_antarctica.AAC.4